MRKLRQPTCTSQVLLALRNQDDFMSIHMLMEATHLVYNQVHATLHHLRSVRAVDVVVNPDGQGWWFALPKDSDTRRRPYDERTPERGPRKLRKGKKMERTDGKA